jgi:hypothetical protein
MNTRQPFMFTITRGCNRRVWVQVKDVDYYVGQTIREAKEWIKNYCKENNGYVMMVVKEIAI